MTKLRRSSLNIETVCAAAGDQPASVTQPLAMPIVAASVFAVDSLERLAAIAEGRDEGFLYARGANPNQAMLEGLVAQLEGAEAGLACASGMGAIAVALMTTLKSGDRVVADSALYGRTATLIAGPLAALGIRPEFADLVDTETAERVLAQPAAAVIVESISNPLLRIADVARLAGLAHAAGARLIVDNTAATPYHCRPIRHGADVVVHSGAKFLCGHSDATCGILAGAAGFVAAAREIMLTLGCPAAPFDCWLTARGLKTLAVRMERASANAEQVAAFLAGCEDAVSAVIYPGLPLQAWHRQARQLLERGHGALIAFELRGGYCAASAFVRGLEQIQLAPSFGDVSTTIAYPAGINEAQPAEGAPEPVPAGLLRLSVGIEHTNDIIADLERGLLAARAAPCD